MWFCMLQCRALTEGAPGEIFHAGYIIRPTDGLSLKEKAYKAGCSLSI